MEQGLEPEMLKAPKKLPHPDQKTRAFDLKYERYIDREDVRNASFNLKKFIGAETIILAVLAAVLIYMVLYNLNRGDNIFANGMYDGTHVLHDSIRRVARVASKPLVDAWHHRWRLHRNHRKQLDRVRILPVAIDRSRDGRVHERGESSRARHRVSQGIQGKICQLV